MTEVTVAAKFTAIIAFAALLLVGLVRLIQSRFNSSTNKRDLTNFIPEKPHYPRESLGTHPTSRPAEPYVRPTFKRNSSEDDLIARSFEIKGILKNDLLEHDNQHATKLTDSLHIGI